MPDNSKMYWVHALTSLHVGSGRGISFIDLPIMREKVTTWPFVPGSSIKGVLADSYGATEEKRKTDPLLKAAFGRSEDDDAGSNSGSLIFTDARLVCFPVRSLFGTFAWVTSALALQRLHRDLEAAGLAGDLQTPQNLPSDGLLLPQDAGSVLKDTSTGKVYLEDLDFPADEHAIVQGWARRLAEWIFSEQSWQTVFMQRFAVIPNDSFDFLTETGTEVHARVRIAQESKTVESGALWYEESLPAETILAGIVWCDKVFPRHSVTHEQLMQEFCSTERHLQIGGKATIGRGQVRCRFSGKGA